MLEKIEKIQALLNVPNVDADTETAIINMKILNLLVDLRAEAKQLILSGVSKSFNSEEELLQFIYMHTPIAVKPKSKRAKGQLVSAFKSGNAFDQVCRHLAKKLFNVY